jgi:hypothetical protein
MKLLLKKLDISVEDVSHTFPPPPPPTTANTAPTTTATTSITVVLKPPYLFFWSIKGRVISHLAFSYLAMADGKRTPPQTLSSDGRDTRLVTASAQEASYYTKRVSQRLC